MTSAHPLALSLRGLRMAYGDQVVLDGIDLDLPKGQVLALLGASGSGKTTLLRLVAGLLMPTAGTVEIAGQTVAAPERGVVLPPEKRGLGMVVQDYALWPHLSVARNVAFPLEMQRLPAAERAARVTQALARVGLGQRTDHQPAQLSGGQQQRVAIARALVNNPSMILADEPTGALDSQTSEEILQLFHKLNDDGMTVIVVTHEPEVAEACRRKLVFRDGVLIEDLALTRGSN